MFIFLSDLPDERAWGKVKHKFYGADVDEDDAGIYCHYIFFSQLP
jgi:hypothetical protein